jgi:hypothetical protein
MVTKPSNQDASGKPKDDGNAADGKMNRGPYAALTPNKAGQGKPQPEKKPDAAAEVPTIPSEEQGYKPKPGEARGLPWS